MIEVKIKTKEALNLLGAIDRISESDQELPTKFLYAISRTRSKIKGVSDSYNEVSSSLFKKYGLKGKPRDKYTEKDNKNVVKIDEELSDILNEEISVEIYQYPSKDFFDSKTEMKPTPGFSLIMDYVLSEELKPVKNEAK